GWYLRRTGKARWFWPFSDTQIVWGPTQQFYETWQTRRMDEFAVRADLNGLDLVVLNDVLPYVTYVNRYSDDAQDWKFPAFPYSQNNRAYAFGLDAGVWGGGKLQAEAAYSDWSRSDLPQAYVDSAFNGNFSKSVGPLTLSALYAHIGADF